MIKDVYIVGSYRRTLFERTPRIGLLIPSNAGRLPVEVFYDGSSFILKVNTSKFTKTKAMDISHGS